LAIPIGDALSDVGGAIVNVCAAIQSFVSSADVGLLTVVKEDSLCKSRVVSPFSFRPPGLLACLLRLSAPTASD
jgi:hypothetical protein